MFKTKDSIILNMVNKSLVLLNDSFKIIKEERLEFIDAFIKMDIEELIDAIHILNAVLNVPKKDVGVLILFDLMRELYDGDISEDVFRFKVLNCDKDTYKKYEGVLLSVM